MKKWATFLKILILQLAILSCAKNKEVTPSPTPILTLSPDVRNYILEMVRIMKANSINKSTIDWDNFTAGVLKEAGNAQSTSQAESALRLALTLLKDDHSFIKVNSSKYIFGESSSAVYTANSDFIGAVPENVGYIQVGGNFMASTDPAIMAQSIQNDIKKADKEGLKGWIVDLRGNGGGNMWPMLAGLGPILGEGTLGYFIDNDNIEYPWAYSRGSSQLNYRNVTTVPLPYSLLKANPKVAVLINKTIASSGEATTIAFKSRPNTKFFGTPTFGLSTANQAYNLSDNSILFLTVSRMADRNKNVFGKKVNPDVNLSTADSTNSEAIKWLIQ